MGLLYPSYPGQIRATPRILRISSTPPHRRHDPHLAFHLIDDPKQYPIHPLPPDTPALELTNARKPPSPPLPSSNSHRDRRSVLATEEPKHGGRLALYLRRAEMAISGLGRVLFAEVLESPAVISSRCLMFRRGSTGVLQHSWTRGWSMLFGLWFLAEKLRNRMSRIRLLAISDCFFNILADNWCI